MSKKKKEKVKEKKLAFSQKQLLTISIALSLTIAIIFTIFTLQSTDIPFAMNAVIIDQLARDAPNPTFVAEATSILQLRHFSVTYYNDYNESLNVDFFRKLATGNYGIIILRVHSALRVDNSTVDLFTSEEWASGKYPPELVVPGNYSYNPEKFYCAITHEFIRNLEGYFPKSIVVAMGCWSLKPDPKPLLAEAFIRKRAKAYVGWTSVVLPSHTDNDTITFLKRLLIQNKTLEDATSHLEHTYYDPELKQNITTTLTYYPLEMRNLKISDLLAEVRSSKALMLFSDVFPVFTAKVEFLQTKLKFAC
jgi:hypothetical protein